MLCAVFDGFYLRKVLVCQIELFLLNFDLLLYLFLSRHNHVMSNFLSETVRPVFIGGCEGNCP